MRAGANVLRARLSTLRRGGIFHKPARHLIGQLSRKSHHEFDAYWLRSARSGSRSFAQLAYVLSLAASSTQGNEIHISTRRGETEYGPSRAGWVISGRSDSHDLGSSIRDDARAACS